MYTTVAQFLAENNKRKKKGLKPLNEEFGSNDFDMDNDDFSGDEDFEDNDDFSGDDDFEAEEPQMTLESFTEAVNAKFNEYVENLEEGEESPEMLSEVQIQIAFDACQSLCSTPEEEEEIVEEGLFGGPSKEEIEAGRKGAEERLKQIEAANSGKTLTFMEKGDNKQIPYSFEAAMKVAEKNKFRGVIKTINQGDKIVLIYEPGKTLLQKLAAGTTTQTTGA